MKPNDQTLQLEIHTQGIIIQNKNVLSLPELDQVIREILVTKIEVLNHYIARMRDYAKPNLTYAYRIT